MARARKPKVNRDEWGSVTRLPDGAWRLRYQGPDGKRRDGGRYRTRLEAEDARARLRASILGGTWRPATSTGSPLMADYAAAWLQRAELSEQLSPRTVVLYRRMFERLVLPDLGGIELGRVPVARLTRETVMAWELAARAASRASAARHADGMNGAAAARRRGHPARAWARSAGLTVPLTGRLPAVVVQAWQDAGAPTAPGTPGGRGSGDRQFEQARTVLSSVCTSAVEDGYLLEHPVRMRPGTRARRRPHGVARVAPIVAVDVLLRLVEQMPAPYGLAALVTAFAGLRGGETFALTTRHLRYGPSGVVSHVRVDRALVELPGAPVSFGPPKTNAGVREVAIPEQIGRLLADHAAALATGLDTLLFTTTTGQPIRCHHRSQAIARARTAVPGAEHLTWHGLRHTGLTLAAAVPGAHRSQHHGPRRPQHPTRRPDLPTHRGLGRRTHRRRPRSPAPPRHRGHYGETGSSQMRV